MRHSLLVLVAASTALLLGFEAYGFQPPKPPRPKYWNTGWVSLFNGKDLTGWVPVGKEKWTVEDGAIHGEAVTKDYGYLRTEKKYKDFHLSLRFLCVGTGNSGVFVHSDFKPGTADVSQGMQFEIDPHLNHHTGGLYGDGREWIAWPAAEYEGVIHPTDWNDYLLIVEANRYIAWLNGIKILDFTDPAPRSFDGYISLQLHAGGEGSMKFKDLAIQDLSQR